MIRLLTLSVILILSAFSTSCFTGAEKGVDSVYLDYDHYAVPYQLYRPDTMYRLDSDLEEISGLTYADDGHILAIEDETGHIYELDPGTGEVLNKVKFGKAGDYEGIEILNNTLYVIESNGDLTRNSMPLMVQEGEKHETVFSSDNNVEGLGHYNAQLLVACKRWGQVDNNGVDGKGIYLLNMQNGKVSLVAELREEELESLVKDRTDFNKINDFDPSGIATHPGSGDIYIISADRVIVVLDASFKLKEVVPLNPELFYQPEGICFTPTGDLFISNEGGGHRATLLRFSSL